MGMRLNSFDRQTRQALIEALRPGDPRKTLPFLEPHSGVTEAQFQASIIEFAQSCDWRVAHFRKVRVQRKSGEVYWETPVAADGKGFPDLILIRGTLLIAVELKVGKNTPSAEQLEWLERFRESGHDAYVWYPKDFVEIDLVLR